MVGALQTAVTRRVDTHQPVVLTIARIVAGTTTNIIPETAFMEGTVRTLSETSRATVHDEIGRVCRYTAMAHGCTAEVRDRAGLPGHRQRRRRRRPGRQASRTPCSGATGSSRCTTPIMGAEDFSYVLAEVPGALAFLGGCPPGVHPGTAPPNHSNRVVFDEDAMAAGVAVYAGLALDALAK